MTDLSEDELHAMERSHRADEVERCALLAEELAGRWERSAVKMREDGSYRGLFGGVGIHPKWARCALDLEAAAHGLRTVARGCREGWDTRVADKRESGAAKAYDAEKLREMRC